MLFCTEDPNPWHLQDSWSNFDRLSLTLQAAPAMADDVTPPLAPTPPMGAHPVLIRRRDGGRTCQGGHMTRDEVAGAAQERIRIFGALERVFPQARLIELHALRPDDGSITALLRLPTRSGKASVAINDIPPTGAALVGPLTASAVDMASGVG
jgi:hypothetical protein